MAAPLPLHPDAARPPGPAHEIRSRRDAVRGKLGAANWRARTRALFPAAARATLRLTGVDVSAGPELAAPLAVIARLESAAGARDPTPEIIAEAHAVATGAAAASSFRTLQIEPQFSGSRLSPPQTIALRLGELLQWLSGTSGKDLETASRAALFFARFLEISPFERANFRVAHLMLTFFALADDLPPIWFEVGDAPGIREDVSRAFRFDTGPLTARIEAAIRISLDRVAGGGTDRSPPG